MPNIIVVDKNNKSIKYPAPPLSDEELLAWIGDMIKQLEKGELLQVVITK